MRLDTPQTHSMSRRRLFWYTQSLWAHKTKLCGQRLLSFVRRKFHWIAHCKIVYVRSLNSFQKRYISFKAQKTRVPILFMHWRCAKRINKVTYDLYKLYVQLKTKHQTFDFKQKANPRFIFFLQIYNSSKRQNVESFNRLYVTACVVTIIWEQRVWLS